MCGLIAAPPPTPPNPRSAHPAPAIHPTPHAAARPAPAARTPAAVRPSRPSRHTSPNHAPDRNSHPFGADKPSRSCPAAPSHRFPRPAARCSWPRSSPPGTPAISPRPALRQTPPVPSANFQRRGNPAALEPIVLAGIPRKIRIPIAKTLPIPRQSRRSQALGQALRIPDRRILHPHGRVRILPPSLPGPVGITFLEFELGLMRRGDDSSVPRHHRQRHLEGRSRRHPRRAIAVLNQHRPRRRIGNQGADVAGLGPSAPPRKAGTSARTDKNRKKSSRLVLGDVIGKLRRFVGGRSRSVFVTKEI